MTILKKKTIGMLLLFYGVASFFVASNTIDFRPMGLVSINVGVAATPIYQFFNPIAAMLPYIAGGQELSVSNMMVQLAYWGYPLSCIALGLFFWRPWMKKRET